MSYKNIIVETSDGLAFIKIHRPEVKNALNQETLDEMQHALGTLLHDLNTGCIIFTGEGESSFAAGADIASLKEREPLYYLKKGTIQDFFNYVEAYEKPTIAMINGYALGGGCELALACDIRVASRKAKIGLPELNLGIIPGAGGTQRLSRIVGKGKAVEMILTGKIVSAEEAERIGLVSLSVPPEELKQETVKIAEQILAKGPVAVRLAKIAIHYGFETDSKTGMMLERLSQAIAFATEDKQEGTSAFLEKRRPNFKGR